MSFLKLVDCPLWSVVHSHLLTASISSSSSDCWMTHNPLNTNTRVPHVQGGGQTPRQVHSTPTHSNSSAESFFNQTSGSHRFLSVHWSKGLVYQTEHAQQPCIQYLVYNKHTCKCKSFRCPSSHVRNPHDRASVGLMSQTVCVSRHGDICRIVDSTD